MKISEKSFEEAIEAALLASGPDTASDSEVVERGSAYGEGSPGGYRKRSPEEYERELCVCFTNRAKRMSKNAFANSLSTSGGAEKAARRPLRRLVHLNQS